MKAKPVPKKNTSLDPCGALVIAGNASVAAHLLRVTRDELFTLRDRGFAGFHPSSRVYMLHLRDAVMAWKPRTDKDTAAQFYWQMKFYLWMDRAGLPGVAPAWQGRGNGHLDPQEGNDPSL